MKKVMLIVSLLFNGLINAQNVVTVSEDFSTSREVPLIGYNCALNNAPDLSDENFVSAIQTLNPKVLRYPGGTLGNYWDWETGSYIDKETLLFHLKENNVTNPITGEIINDDFTLADLEAAIFTGRSSYTESEENGLWSHWWNFMQKDPISYTPVKFAKAIEATNSEAIIQLNILTSDINTQIALIDEFVDMGLDIKKIELGNEINHSTSGTDELMLKKYPSAHAYVDDCINWMQAIWAVYPNMKIGVVGGNQGSSQRASHWNETLIAAIDLLPETDKLKVAFILHHYTYLGNLPEEILCNEGETSPSAINEIKWLFGYPQLVVKHHFGSWWQNFEVVLEAGYKVWITEFNFHEERGTEKVVSNTWAQGLYNSLLLEQYLNYCSNNIDNPDYRSNIEMIISHNIGNYSDSSTQPNFNALGISKSSKVYEVTATGLVLNLWSDVFENAYSINKLNFIGSNESWNLYYPSKNTGSYPDNLGGDFWIDAHKLHGYKSYSNSNEKAVIVNTSKEEFTIDLMEFIDSPSNYMWESYRALPGAITKGKRGGTVSTSTACLTNIADWSYSKEDLSASSIVVIPPYSINTFMEPCSKNVVAYEAKNITTQSVELAWQGWLNYGDSYTVSYREIGTNQWNIVNLLSPNSTSTIITGLSSGTTYEWKVTANCASVANTYDSQFTTASCTPPNHVKIDNISAHAIELSWEEADQAIQYSYYLTNLNGDIVRSGVTSDNTILITGLDLGTQYNFRILSECSSEESQFTQFINVHTSLTDDCNLYIDNDPVSINNDLVTFTWNEDYSFPMNQVVDPLVFKSISKYDVGFKHQCRSEFSYSTANRETSKVIDLSSDGQGDGPGVYYWHIRYSCFEGGVSIEGNESFTIGTSVSCGARIVLNDFLIYPNPLREKVNVSFTLTEMETVVLSLLNLQGQVVLQSGAQVLEGAYTNQLDVRDLPTGVYILQVKGEDWSTEEKVYIGE